MAMDQPTRRMKTTDMAPPLQYHLGDRPFGLFPHLVEAPVGEQKRNGLLKKLRSMLVIARFFSDLLGKIKVCSFRLQKPMHRCEPPS